MENIRSAGILSESGYEMSMHSALNVLRGLNSKLGVISQGIDALWNADLADVSNLTKHNGSTKYLLVAIHVFSRYLWIEPLKNKLFESIIKALQNR